MRINTVPPSNLLHGQTQKPLNRAVATNTTGVGLRSEEELIYLLFKDCAELTASNLGRAGEFTKTDCLSRKYVAEGKPVSLVGVYSDRTNTRKIAYIGSSNWGCGVLVPLNSGIDIFTDGASACPLLIMSLIDKASELYIFLAHVYCNNIDDQVSNIVENLKGKNMSPVEVIFAPSKYSDFTTAKGVLERFLGKDITFIRRENTSSGLATKDGWSIYDTGYKTRNTQLWNTQGSNSVDSQSQKFTLEPCSVSCDLLPVKLHYSDSVEFSSDLSVALVSNANEIKVFDIKKKKEIFSSRSGITCATLSPDGSRLIAVIWGGKVKLWDILPEVKAIDCKVSLFNHHGDIKFHPDKSKILVGLTPAYARPQLIDIETGKVLVNFSEASYSTAIGNSNDGTKVAAGSGYGVVTLFDSQNGNRLLSFDAHHNTVTSISFSRNDSKILTAGGEQLVKVWDAKTGRELQYIFHNYPVKSAFFNTDDRSILIAGSLSAEGVTLHYPIDL